MPERKLRVAHIVPALDIGGVEMGIARSLPVLRERFDYRVYYVRRRGRLDCGQASVQSLCADIVRGAFRPDVVLTSLWWAHPVGWLLRSTGARWLAFFHNTNFAHRADEASLRWAWGAADACIVDSHATRTAMGAGKQAQRVHVVPYIFSNETTDTTPWLDRSTDVIWVGRSHAVKRLDLLCALLEKLAQAKPHAHVTIVIAGTPPARLSALRGSSTLRISIVQDADSAHVRRLLGDARFYVLLSDAEGMSMSTVEAVQAGCVAVTRPVGEIPRYIDAEGGLLLDDISPSGLSAAVDRMVAMWQDGPRATAMIDHARSRLEELPSYSHALVNALSDAGLGSCSS